MVTQFNPRNPKIGSLVKDNWNIIQNTEELTQIFRTKPLIGYRRLPNLKDILTSSSILYLPVPKPLTPATQFLPICTRFGRCTYCPKFKKLEHITSFHTKKTFKCQTLPPKHKITCELSNVIYIINCNQCGLQYTGETKRPIRNRMCEHYSSVQKFQAEKATPVSRHFTQKNHSVRNKEFSILHWMGDPTSPNAKIRCRRQELCYIWAFPTLHPAGINMLCMRICPLIAPLTQVHPLPFTFYLCLKLIHTAYYTHFMVKSLSEHNV